MNLIKNLKFGGMKMWITGNYKGYEYQAKVYPEPSEYGIDFGEEDDGRISKLDVSKNGRVVCCYDRGWVKLPIEDNDLDAVSEIIRKHN